MEVILSYYQKSYNKIVFTDNGVGIGEHDNIIELITSKWNTLVEKIKSDELC